MSVSGKKLAVSTAPKLYYFMVNKPKGYICSSVETQEGRGKRVVDLLAPWLADWGRRNTEKVRNSADQWKRACGPEPCCTGMTNPSRFQPSVWCAVIPRPPFCRFGYSSSTSSSYSAKRIRSLSVACAHSAPLLFCSLARRKCCPPASSRWAASTSPPTASSSSPTTGTGHRR